MKMKNCGSMWIYSFDIYTETARNHDYYNFLLASLVVTSKNKYFWFFRLPSRMRNICFWFSLFPKQGWRILQTCQKIEGRRGETTLPSSAIKLLAIPMLFFFPYLNLELSCKIQEVAYLALSAALGGFWWWYLLPTHPQTWLWSGWLPSYWGIPTLCSFNQLLLFLFACPAPATWFGRPSLPIFVIKSLH